MLNFPMNPKSHLSQFVVVTACTLLLAGCGGGSGESGSGESGSGESGSASGPFVVPTTGFSAGSSTIKVEDNDEVLPPSSGEFRTVCLPSHMAYDDPLVFPNQPGASHLHTFFGNTGINAFSTVDSVLNTGNSTCRGGIINRTGYWVPSMIDTRTNTALIPTESHFYYKHDPIGTRIPSASVEPFPPGLRMIAGDPRHTSANFDDHHARFICHDNADLRGPAIQNCNAGTKLVQEIFFPNCWNGRDLDSPDHKSHMAYSLPYYDPVGGCPTTHPRPLPQISVNVHYNITEPDQATHWRLSSDNYSGPAGYSSHSDWWNGWDQQILKTWVHGCINAAVDCHSGFLGDGRVLFD